MPPSLASCLTVLLILWLFYRNAKRESRSSIAVWLPTIWAVTLASRPLGSWYGEQSLATATADGSPIDRVVLLVLIVSAVFVLSRRGTRWGDAMRSNLWLWLFFLYLLVSVAWSDYPFISFKRWFREFGNLLMILVILTEENPEEAVRQVMVRCAYVLIPISILLIKYYPAFGKAYNFWTGAPEYCGVANDKNALGRLVMLGGLFLLWNLILQSKSGWQKWKNALPDMLILAMCVWILRIADSQTALGCFCVGTAVLFGSRVGWVHANPRRLAVLGGALILVSFVFFYFPDLRQIVTTALGRKVNLTDRTDVWAGAMAAGTDPLIGTGFGSFWLTPKGLSLGMRLSVTEAHNGFLETYLNSGLIGVGFLLVVLFTAGRNVIGQFVAGGPNASLYAALFFSGVIYNYTEADFNTNSIVGFVLWTIAMRYEAVPGAAVAVSTEAVGSGNFLKSPTPRFLNPPFSKMQMNEAHRDISRM